MTLDIHRLENGQAQEKLISIGNAEFGLLEPGFKLFSKKTGLPIDPYRDLKLSSGLQALIQALEETRKHEKSKEAKGIMESLLRVLYEAQSKGHSIIFCGD